MRKNEPTAVFRVAAPIPFYDLDGQLLKNQTFLTASGEVFVYRSDTNDFVAAGHDAVEIGGANTTGTYQVQFDQGEVNKDTIVGVKLVKAGFADQFWWEKVDPINAAVDTAQTAITDIQGDVDAVETAVLDVQTDVDEVQALVAAPAIAAAVWLAKVFDYRYTANYTFGAQMMSQNAKYRTVEADTAFSVFYSAFINVTSVGSTYDVELIRDATDTVLTSPADYTVTTDGGGGFFFLFPNGLPAGHNAQLYFFIALPGGAFIEFFYEIEVVPVRTVETAIAVWDALSADHLVSGSMGELFQIIAGLHKHNSILDKTVYNAKKFLTSARIRKFATKAAFDAAVPDHADGADGEQFRWLVTGADVGDGTVDYFTIELVFP